MPEDWEKCVFLTVFPVRIYPYVFWPSIFPLGHYFVYFGLIFILSHWLFFCLCHRTLCSTWCFVALWEAENTDGSTYLLGRFSRERQNFLRGHRGCPQGSSDDLEGTTSCSVSSQKDSLQRSSELIGGISSCPDKGLIKMNQGQGQCSGEMTLPALTGCSEQSFSEPAPPFASLWSFCYKNVTQGPGLSRSSGVYFRKLFLERPTLGIPESSPCENIQYFLRQDRKNSQLTKSSKKPV